MKKTLIITTLILCFFLFPFYVYAEEETIVQNEETETIVEDDSEEDLEDDQEGNQEDDSEENEELEDEEENQNEEIETKKGGQVEIDGYLYYFDEDGNQITGFIEEDGKIYFYSRTYGHALKGWVKSVAEGTWYQNEDGSLLVGVHEIEGEKYYFDEEGKLKTGFIEEDGKIYFYSRTYGYALKGWVSNWEGKWYQTEDGSLLTGKQIIDGEKYYFGEDGKLITGFIEEDGKIYFYSRTYGHALKGWVKSVAEGTWYQNEDGSLLVGVHEIEGEKYYFDEEGKLKTGFIEEDGKIYFYSRTYGYALKGWVSNWEGKWYQTEDGSLLIGRQEIDGKYYFFGEDGKQKTGFIEDDGKLFFYSRTYGYTLSGLIHNAVDGAWYQLEDGEVLIANGVQEIEGKEYFFAGRSIKSGLITVEGKKYYFDDSTYEKRVGIVNKKYYDFILDNTTGELIAKQYKPVYFMQTDSRWGRIKYGRKYFETTGCVPTSLAMAYSAVLGKEVYPNEVGDFLYYHTDQFNRRLSGTSGMGIIHASNYFGVKYTGLSSKEEIINALKAGKVVYGTMGNGKFATPRWNHAIIMYNYNESNNTTYTLDPIEQLNNSWTSIDLIWREQCTDPDDRLGGYTFYSLEER